MSADKLLGKLLKTSREVRGLAQTEVAAAVAIPRGAVSRAEAGERPVKVREFLPWCRAVDRVPAEVVRELEQGVLAVAELARLEREQC